MPDSKHKIVKVDGIGTVAFPGHFTDSDVQNAVAKHKRKPSLPSYSLQDVPAFLRPTAAQSKVVIQPPNGRDIAVVHSTSPKVVDVNERAQFGQPQLNHEETHVFDFSRNPAIVQRMEEDLRSGKLPKSYTYGGIEGLLEAQRQGKTIANFGPEQRAEMVRNFQQETQDAIRRGDAARLDLLNRAYGPFIRQEANLPGKNESMTTMTQKDLTPPAPGLPPAVESGILAPNPLLGGKERFLRVPPGPLQQVKLKAAELRSKMKPAQPNRYTHIYDAVNKKLLSVQ